MPRATSLNHFSSLVFHGGHRIDAPAFTPTVGGMKQLGFTYWQDGDAWLGYLDEFPDYMTQGSNLEDLREHLLDLYQDLTSGVIPHVRHHSVLEVA
jgi:hypothetical protein